MEPLEEITATTKAIAAVGTLPAALAELRVLEEEHAMAVQELISAEETLSLALQQEFESKCALSHYKETLRASLPGVDYETLKDRADILSQLIVSQKRAIAAIYAAGEVETANTSNIAASAATPTPIVDDQISTPRDDVIVARIDGAVCLAISENMFKLMEDDKRRWEPAGRYEKFMDGLTNDGLDNLCRLATRDVIGAFSSYGHLPDTPSSQYDINFGYLLTIMRQKLIQQQGKYYTALPRGYVVEFKYETSKMAIRGTQQQTMKVWNKRYAQYEMFITPTPHGNVGHTYHGRALLLQKSGSTGANIPVWIHSSYAAYVKMSW